MSSAAAGALISALAGGLYRSMWRERWCRRRCCSPRVVAARARAFAGAWRALGAAGVLSDCDQRAQTSAAKQRTVGGFALRRREALSDARARRLVTSLTTFGARFGTRSAQRGVHVTFAPKLGRRSGAPRLARAAARRTAGPRVRRESPAPFDERRAPPAAVWVSVHLTPSGHGRA